MARTSVKFILLGVIVILILLVLASVRKNSATIVQPGERDESLSTLRKVSFASPAYEAGKGRDRIKFVNPFEEGSRRRGEEHNTELHGTPSLEEQAQDRNVNNIEQQTKDRNGNNKEQQAKNLNGNYDFKKESALEKYGTGETKGRNEEEERINVKEEERINVGKEERVNVKEEEKVNVKEKERINVKEEERVNVEEEERANVKVEERINVKEEERVNEKEEEERVGGNKEANEVRGRDMEDEGAVLKYTKNVETVWNDERQNGNKLEDKHVNSLRNNLDEGSWVNNPDGEEKGQDKLKEDVNSQIPGSQRGLESTTVHNFYPNKVPGDQSHGIDGSSVSTTTHEQEVSTQLPPMPTFYPSKDLFVRAVYFDGRPRDGHKNTSVFLVVCIRNVTDNNLIVGCQVDGNKASNFSVKLIGETPLWRMFYPKINHEEVLVHCYDLPANNGSNGYIMYKMKKDSAVVTAASERPLVIPAPRIEPTTPEGIKYNMTIVACAKIFNKPPWLKEWLTYQRTLGINHVHLDVEDSFVNGGGLERQYVKEMMNEGFLSIDVWKQYLGMWELWYHNQGLIYEDCPYRFLGTYDYIVMLDTDDFFIPREPSEMKIHYYINKYCRRNHIGSCKFKWVEYYPDVYGFNNKSTKDGNITRALNNYSHYFQGNPKSLHRTTALIDTATHYAYIMMPEYKIFDVPLSIAYVAHVRKFKQLPNIGLVEGIPNSCMEHCINRIFIVMEVCLIYVIFNLLGWSHFAF